MLRITLAQLNFTLADLQGNVAQMVAAAEQAHAQGAQLVVFSELSLTGYSPGDWLLEEDFMDGVELAFDSLLQASQRWPELHWVIGLPLRHKGPGRKLKNMLRVIRNGQTVLEYAKQLLPSYDVFNERRYFEPGADAIKILRIKNMQVGFLICEDAWNNAYADYPVNPLDRLRDASPDLVISINASPSHVGKREQRHQVFGEASQRTALPMLYVNQIGGHDEVIYDGASFAVEPAAGIVYEAQRFAPEIQTLSFDDEEGHFVLPDAVKPAQQDLTPMAFYRAQIRLGLRDFARRCGFERVVVGSSGGIDSALTLALAVEALGAENVTAVTMPSQFSSTGSVEDSKTLCRNLGIRLLEHPIAPLVENYAQAFHSAFGTPLQGVAYENLQARVRGTVLMEYANQFGALLLTTGNKSEIAVGYCTLYGDTNGGLGLLGDLYKTEVFELSRYLNAQAGRESIPQSIIDKPPSAELAPNQKDSDSLPEYPVLDEILKWLIEGPAQGAQPAAFVAELRETEEGAAVVQRVISLLARSEHKRHQTAPVLRLHARAFGAGWSMPIAAKTSMLRI